MKSFLKEWWGLVLFFLAFVVFVIFMINDLTKGNRAGNLEKEYCGTVIDKGYDSPSSGYKSHTEAQYWVVFMDKDIHKAVRVHVTPDCFYSLNKGSNVCFNLTGYEMEEYGNTNDYSHLK